MRSHTVENSNGGKIELELMKQNRKCEEKFCTWEFARSRAHKGMTLVVVGLLAVLISVGVRQFYWAAGRHEARASEIYELKYDTGLQLKELQARQGLILEKLDDLGNKIQRLTERMEARLDSQD